MVNATSTLYNLTPAAGQDDIYGFVSAVNDMTGQVFMIGIVLVTFVIFFVALMRYGTADALLVSGFITSIMAVMFASIDLVPVFITTIIVIAYGLFFTYRMVTR